MLLLNGMLGVLASSDLPCLTHYTFFPCHSLSLWSRFLLGGGACGLRAPIADRRDPLLLAARCRAPFALGSSCRSAC